MTATHELEGAIEAVLFVSSEPVRTDRLVELFDVPRERVEAALEAVVERYRSTESRGVTIDRAGGGLRLVTRPELHGYLRKYFQVTGRTKLSMAALETLAIIAYRQPITAPEIQELRGVSASGVLKTLLEHRLVRIAGRKAVVGKPFLYCTSKDFLLRFGLESLKDLPPLDEVEDLLKSQLDADLVEEGDPEEADEPSVGGTLLLWQSPEEAEDGRAHDPANEESTPEAPEG
ncbi:MAG: SMC-Scp complex subunit ScpB [Acidobacteriota bacterium]|nr:SMC-Scp complex subunit ScpB [Acidobacteriota bacterium]